MYLFIDTQGIQLVSELIDEYGLDVVQAYMTHIQNNAELAVRDMLKVRNSGPYVLAIRSLSYIAKSSLCFIFFTFITGRLKLILSLDGYNKNFMYLKCFFFIVQPATCLLYFAKRYLAKKLFSWTVAIITIKFLPS